MVWFILALQNHDYQGKERRNVNHWMDINHIFKSATLRFVSFCLCLCYKKNQIYITLYENETEEYSNLCNIDKVQTYLSIVDHNTHKLWLYAAIYDIIKSSLSSGYQKLQYIKKANNCLLWFQIRHWLFLFLSWRKQNLSCDLVKG